MSSGFLLNGSLPTCRTPDLEGQDSPLCLAPTLFPVRHGRPYQ